jgi:hypothetical protein
MNRYPLGADVLAEYAMWKSGEFVTFKLGLSNPSWSDGEQVGGALPLVLSGLPDYVVWHSDGARLLELKGCKGTLRMKLRDVAHLASYVEYLGMDLDVFVWNMDARQWLVISIDVLVDVSQGRQGDEFETDTFPDGVKYVPLPWIWLRDRAIKWGDSAWPRSMEPTDRNIRKRTSEWMTMDDKRRAIG